MWQWPAVLSHPHQRGSTKTTAKPTAAVWATPQPRRLPDPVDQADTWIQVQMGQKGRHPYWLKELRALYWGCLVGDLSNFHTLQFAQWQAKAFRVPLAQAEAYGWWEAPHNLGTLHHQDSLPQVDSPYLRDFCVTRQEEILALAWALQHCREVRDTWSPVQGGIGPPKVHGPLMQLDSAQNAPNLGGRSNTPGGWTRTPSGSGHYHVSPWMPQNPRTRGANQAVWHSSPPAPLHMASNSHGNWSWNTRRAQFRARPQGLPTPDQDNPNDWIWAYIQGREELLSWW